jgi:hypothetical protein
MCWVGMRAGGAAASTREQMRRDKNMHRLGLAAVEGLPSGVLVDICQRLCIALDTPDATSLPSLVAKLLEAATTIPRMEQFITDICEVRACSQDSLALALIFNDLQHPRDIFIRSNTSITNRGMRRVHCDTGAACTRIMLHMTIVCPLANRWYSGLAETLWALPQRTLHLCLRF